MAPGTSAAAYNKMTTETPLTTTIGRGMGKATRAVVDTSRQAARNMGSAANNLPKLVGVPAAVAANAGADLGANFMTEFTGKEYVPNQYEGKTFSQLLAGTQAVKPAATAPAPAAQPTAGTTQSDLPGIDGVKDWGGAQVVNTRFASSAKSQPKWEADTGNSPIAQFYRAQQAETAPQAQPTSINVRRQANGVLEFSGSGGGNGTGAVSYTGLPNWKSTQGGAGQGSADFGGEAFKPAQAALAQPPGNPLLDRYQQLTEQVASGSGGIVGTLQARSALRALGPIIERQMANENSVTTTRMGNENAMGVARMREETGRRGQDLGLQGEMARVNASIYGTDVGARTAREAQEAEKYRTALTMSAAVAKASGDPEKIIKSQLLQLEYAAKTGLDPTTGQPISEEQRKQLEQRVLVMKTPQTVVPYGGYGMAAEAE